MDFLTLFVIMAVSTLILFIWQFFTRVFPAYRSAKIHESLAVLTRCFAHLNQDELLNAKITRGGYLHDKFCKTIFLVLTHKISLKFSALKHLTYDKKSEISRRKFRSEIEALDKETREVIAEAIAAIAKILLIRSPIVFTLALIKQARQERHFKLHNGKKYLRKQAIDSAETITVCSRDDDYQFVPI